MLIFNKGKPRKSVDELFIGSSHIGVVGKVPEGSAEEDGKPIGKENWKLRFF